MKDVYIDFVKVMQHNVTVADTVLVVKVTVGYPSQVQSEWISSLVATIHA